MISKIKSITGAGTYDSDYGLLYQFEYEFEDGTSLKANHKKETSPFNVGDEADYEIKGSNDYGSWGKVSKPDDGNFNHSGDATRAYNKKSQGVDINDSILYQVAMKEATQVIVIDGWDGKELMADKLQHLSDIAYQLAFLAKDNIERLGKK